MHSSLAWTFSLVTHQIQLGQWPYTLNLSQPTPLLSVLYVKGSAVNIAMKCYKQCLLLYEQSVPANSSHRQSGPLALFQSSSISVKALRCLWAHYLTAI